MEVDKDWYCCLREMIFGDVLHIPCCKWGQPVLIATVKNVKDVLVSISVLFVNAMISCVSINHKLFSANSHSCSFGWFLSNINKGDPSTKANAFFIALWMSSLSASLVRQSTNISN